MKTDEETHLCFINIIKAFDRVKRKEVWKILKTRGVNDDLRGCTKGTYSRTLRE